MSTYPVDPAQPANHANHADRPVTVTLLVRSTCGSCSRVREQITPLCVDLHADLDVVDVDGETSLAVEFGDRVPVVLVDDERSPAGRSTTTNWWTPSPPREHADPEQPDTGALTEAPAQMRAPSTPRGAAPYTSHTRTLWSSGGGTDTVDIR